jgi:rhodanese-related sulfurtransferase
MPKSAAELVREAKARVESLDPARVAAELERGEAVLVDVREAEERRAEGAVPGALHVPRGVLEFAADPASPAHRAGLEPTRRVILHCASGGRSALAALALQELGYERVAHLGGGFEAWKGAGRPVERVAD